MISEDYVSFEIAKLLKEKGFNYVSFYCYEEKGINDILWVTLSAPLSNSDLDNTIEQHKCYSAPTLQMAMKWLRKEHNLHCSSDYDIVLGWYCQITSLTETVEYDYEEMKHYHPDKDNGFSSPEEACEMAIKYCLEKLI